MLCLIQQCLPPSLTPCCSPALQCRHLDLRQQYFWADAGSDGKSSSYLAWYMIYQLMWGGDVLFTLIQYLCSCSLMYSLSELFELYIAFSTSCTLHTSYNSYFSYYICPVKRMITINLTYIHKTAYANALAWLQIHSIYIKVLFWKAHVLTVDVEK